MNKYFLVILLLMPLSASGLSHSDKVVQSIHSPDAELKGSEN